MFLRSPARIVWLLARAHSKCQNHVFGKKSKQIRSVVFSRGRRHSSHGNANEFLPKGSRVRKSICQPSLHRRGKTEVRDVWECRLSTSTQRCLQGTLQFPGFVLFCFVSFSPCLYQAEGDPAMINYGKGNTSKWSLPTSSYAGRKIAPNTGANATKFFTLATKSWKIVANLATRISNHTLPRDLVIVEDL